MPANRSRTTRWRRCLEQIHERGGAIDIALAANEAGAGDNTNLMWRVRVLALRDDEIVVEQPAALGHTMTFGDDAEVVAVLTVGQNRWRFRTRSIGSEQHGQGRRATMGLRLAMPPVVHRCQRRSHDRVAPGAFVLPTVEIWALLDPKSVVLAERANQLRQTNALDGELPPEDPAIMPEVGPKFTATMLNLGGGGIGLLVAPDHTQAVARHRVFWLRLALPPELEVPICATAKLAHTHMQSDQHLYAGLAFDFSFNPGHQRFVVEQIQRYIARRQQLQSTLRRSA